MGSINNQGSDNFFCDIFAFRNSTENYQIQSPSQNASLDSTDLPIQATAGYSQTTIPSAQINDPLESDLHQAMVQECMDDLLMIIGKGKNLIDEVRESQESQVDYHVPLLVHGNTQDNIPQQNSNFSMKVNDDNQSGGNQVSFNFTLPNTSTRHEDTSTLSYINQINSENNWQFRNGVDPNPATNSSAVVEGNILCQKNTAMLHSNDLPNVASTSNPNMIYISNPNLTVLENEESALAPQTQEDYSHMPLLVHDITQNNITQNNSKSTTTMNTFDKSGKGQIAVNSSSTNLSIRQGATSTLSLTPINQGNSEDKRQLSHVVDTNSVINSSAAMEGNRPGWRNSTMINSKSLLNEASIHNVAPAVNLNGTDVTQAGLTDIQDQETSLTPHTTAPCTQNTRTGTAGRCPQGVLPLYLQKEPDNEEDKKKWNNAKKAHENRESKKNKGVKDTNTIKELRKELNEKNNELNVRTIERDYLQNTLESIKEANKKNKRKSIEEEEPSVKLSPLGKRIKTTNMRNAKTTQDEKKKLNTLLTENNLREKMLRVIQVVVDKRAETEQVKNMEINAKMKNRRGNINSYKLKYKDVNLTDEDIESLKEGNDVTDCAIAFCMALLEEAYESIVRGNKTRLLNPNVTLMLKIGKKVDVIKEKIQMNIKVSEWVLYPINNKIDEMKLSGGTHWSLLLYNKKDRTYYHFDPIASMNEGHAKDLILNTLDYDTFKEGFPNYVEVNCERQKHEYDCGPYIIMYMLIILENILNGNDYNRFNFSSPMPLCEGAVKTREWLLETIKQKIAENERKGTHKRNESRGEKSK